MTVELNTFQRHHLIESIFTRLERVDKLIELFDKEKIYLTITMMRKLF